MQLFANNAVSALASGIGASDTTLTLRSGDGSLFPNPSSPDFFYLTLSQAGSESSWEIVKVTARSTDTLTVVRAQQGTTAAAWNANDKAELRVTAGSHPALLHAASHKSGGSDPISYTDLANLPTLGTAASHAATDFLGASAQAADSALLGGHAASYFQVAGSYLTANQTITLSDDASGSGTTSIPVTLANSGVTAGTYKSVTVDAKGRVTGGTNPTTFSGFGISETTSNLAEGTNLYFTNARAIGATLTGFTAATSSSAITSADSPLTALQKVEYRLALDDAKVTFPGLGTTGSTACAGNDSRLSDARTPTSHTLISHTASGLTGGQLLLATSATAYAFTTITGDVTFSSAGAASISAVTVTGKLLTGLSTSSGGTITASDSILAALGKAEYRMALNDAKVTFPGFSTVTPSASTANGSVGTDTKPPHADHSHPLPKVTQGICWYFQTISTSDPQPAYEIRAASTLKGIRAFQDSGTSSFSSACVITLYKGGTSWKTLTMPTTWTSGTWVSILSSLSDALAVGDSLQAKVTTTGTGYSQIMVELEIEQVAHA